jgi:hypothetical protein
MFDQNIFDNPVLFYSEYCVHSTNFIKILMKHPDAYNTITRICIDVEPQTKKRPKIFYDIQSELDIKVIEVPSIITPGPEYLLAGSDAFDWLESYLKDQTKQDEVLEGFNPIEMGSFSDSYSTYGSSDLYDAKEQTFKFISKPDEKIETPPETSNVSKDDYARKQHERETFDNVAPPNYKGKNNGFASMKKSDVSEKQKDIDKRYQQMMAEREQFGKGVQRT